VKLLAALVLSLAIPASAHAETRTVQAFDQPVGFAPVWTPSQLSAQPGDTIQWRFDQPGNPNAAGASHDLYLVRPGLADERLGASYAGPTVETTVDDPGTYSFYCSIHRDTMQGTISVEPGPPTPPIDPGHPWETPAPPVVVVTGPTPLLNSASPLTTLEAGDTTAPTLRLLKVTTTRRKYRARVTVSEPGTLHARLLRGKRVIASTHTKTTAGTTSITLKRPKRTGRYRLAVWTTDPAGLESAWRYTTLRPTKR
jgi:plastocyanin